MLKQRIQFAHFACISASLTVTSFIFLTTHNHRPLYLSSHNPLSRLLYHSSLNLSRRSLYLSNRLPKRPNRETDHRPLSLSDRRRRVTGHDLTLTPSVSLNRSTFRFAHLISGQRAASKLLFIFNIKLS